MSKLSVQIRRPEDIPLRQRRVLELMASGENTKGIALKMHRTSKDIDYHRKRLMDMVGLYSVAELTQLALRLGLIEISV